MTSLQKDAQLKIIMSQTNYDKDTAEKLFRLLNSLEDNEDVQSVSSNFEVSEDILASLT